MISVIITTKNRLSLLKKILPTYLNQEHVHEIIIINDGSNDQTEQFVKKTAKMNSLIKYYKNPKNIGLAASRNRGILLATGKYIFFGEDDLELSEGYFKLLMNHLISTKADIIAGKRIWMQVGEVKKDAFERTNNYVGHPINKNLLVTNFQVKSKQDLDVPLLDASMLIHHKVFHKVQYDSTTYTGNYWREESDFQINAWHNKFKLVYCSHAISYHLAKIEDSGGCHSMSTYKYEYYVFKNNFNFIKKNKFILSKAFNRSYGYMYLLNFLLFRIKNKFLIPYLVNIKGNLFG